MTPVDHSTHVPPQVAAANAASASTDAAATIASVQPAPQAAQAPLAQPTTATATLAAPIQPHLQNGGGSFQQNSSSDGRQGHHASTEAAAASDTAGTQTAATPDQTFAATAAAATTAPGGVALPADVHPADVASQIVHQADLYRLPGNKGVRIQLHPDDLGGVQVTLRYAAGGGIELHINAEHAATGALVQAGWTELRDALATQGISPDRLVMSITSPQHASQMDFSSNGNNGSGYRSDQGLTAFGGGQQNQQNQQEAGEDARAPRRWTSGSGDDAILASDDTPRATSAATASRIDYRV